MIQRLLLFPNSGYLSERWWHRLANALFWMWLAIVAMGACKVLLLDPFNSCVRVLYSDPSKPWDSWADCGGYPIGFAFRTMASEPPSSIEAGTVFVVFALFAVAVIPSLVYRVGLYVAKGATWKIAK